VPADILDSKLYLIHSHHVHFYPDLKVMAAPDPHHGSIPGYRPGPLLNGPRKAFLASLVIIPVGTYVYLRSRQASEKQSRRLTEEEGRRNWIQIQAEKEKRDLSVKVNRSGGGI